MKSQNNRWAAVLSGACCVASGTLSAQQIDHDPEADHVHGPGHRHSEIEEVVVRATPLSRNVVELSQSATVLSDTALAREAAASIGDTLARLPGLSNASFGQNIGRPVIRGMQGQRVGVLSNNMSSGDASAVSQDHAVSIEPFLADQIEVLRGPSTLLYGSGSIGGVVNTVTHTIPQEIGEVPVSGRAIAKLDSVSEQKFAAGRLDASGENLAFHANAFYRRSDDYEIPGEAELYPDHDEEDGEEDHHGVLENSFLDNEGGSLGASWIGATWRGGASLTAYSSNYGIPGANHHGHDHGDGPDEGHTAMEEEEEEMLVTIDLESDRWDAELVGTEPFGGFGQLSFKVAGIDYTHTEFEGAEIGTVFDSDTTDARVELKHDEWMGMEGAFGLQYQDVDFSAVGEEAFVPDSNTTTQAFFVVESWSLGNWQLDAGLRYEDLDIKAVASDSHPHPHDDGDDEDLEDSERRSFKPFSISAGAVWHSTGDSHVSLSLARAERAPTSQELFSHGPHIASQTFEIGDSSLDIESNLHAEIAYRVHGGRLTGSLVLYADNFSDYIYQQITGEEEDGLPVYQWSQQDADFFGGEIELRYDLGRLDSGHWQFTAFYDYVKAELSDGENVPLMPPSRFGLGLDWDLRQWAATVNWIHAMDHTRVADHETRTQGYDLLNSEVSWLIPTGGHSDWQLFLQGQNLLDEDIRNSTSHLKDQAPQAGRNFILGVRAKF